MSLVQTLKTRARELKRETYVLYQNIDGVTGDRFTAFFFEPLMASELDPRATLGFGPTQPGTFQIISSELDVCAQLLL